MTANTINDAATMRPGGGSALGRIDQYELVRELGGGGFGTVYLAKDTVAGIEVAVKGLPPLIRNNAEELERIRENFALVSRLHHPYIAAALHLQLARDVAYASDDVRQKLRVMPGDTLMVMEYAPGVTLSKWRKQFPGGKVPLDQALQIGWQIAQALDYAHEQHIIHRDIKPSNIMVETKPDGEAVARLLDFGLAAEIRSSMGRVSREVHDTSGTRPYMAPEQWAGRKQGPATDQYALAVLLCELLTGEVPFVSAFETGDPMVMMTAVCNREVELPEDCPRQDSLRCALAKNPSQRFAGCKEFIEAVAKSEPDRKLHSTPKPKGNRALVVLGIAASVLILAVGSGIWYRHHQEVRQLEQARIAAALKVEAERLAHEEAERQAREKAQTERLAREAEERKVEAATKRFIAAYKEKRYDEAARLQHLVNQNDMVVQFCLGYMYHTGRGVAKNATESVRWFRKAAEQGNASAQCNLGWMYAKGCGVMKDEGEAAWWYRKSATQGNVDAQYNLGVMYAIGRGVAKDDTEALKWFRKAAEQGGVSAQYSLGWMYENGRGVAKWYGEAVRWYRKAAEQGDEDAKAALKRLGLQR